MNMMGIVAMCTGMPKEINNSSRYDPLIELPETVEAILATMQRMNGILKWRLVRMSIKESCDFSNAKSASRL